MFCNQLYDQHGWKKWGIWEVYSLKILEFGENCLFVHTTK